MSDDEARLTVGIGYPAGQLAKAFQTASSHEDAETRRRAEERARRWAQVLSGMADGTLTIGSRAPVAGLPGWATPEVVRGGFTTGAAAAGGPLLPYEIDAAARAGVPADRKAVFGYYLTDAGLADLLGMLDGGRFRIDLPEEAGLLTVAWLLRAGDRLAAMTLLDSLAPLSDQLRFAPRPGDALVPDATDVYRETVGEVRGAVARRRPNKRVEAMREALTVWNPFADNLLTHWLETAEDGLVGQRTPDGWRDRGAALLDRYQALAAANTLCSKHRRPRENMAILRAALDDAVAGRQLDPRRRGLLQHAVDSMLLRRSRPGSTAHGALRARQAANASLPSHHALAQIVIGRLATLPQEEGVRSTEPLTQPITKQEAAETGVPAGSEIPCSIRQAVDRALAGPIEKLIEQGVVPSAEVLAGLVPQLAATTTAMVYPDDALRGVMAANYRAFRKRRSLLLLNLAHQVQIEELPWVRAVAAYRRSDRDAQDQSRAALVRLGELAVQGFPATILPNRLIRELDALGRDAGLDLPFVEELAADIFMGSFSPKFLQAAKQAAELLRGTLYERYYGIDYQAVLRMNETVRRRRFLRRRPKDFGSLCWARSGAPTGRFSVAANGMVIEQSQILTTHNLATLVRPVGIAPAVGWPALARRCFVTVCRQLARVHHNPSPLRTVKDAAYAWRQMVLFLSLSSPEEQASLARWAEDEARMQPEEVAARLTPALAGLRHVLDGGSFDRDGTAGAGRRFLGWAVHRHWMLSAPAGSARR